MAVIKKKNLLRYSDKDRQEWWDKNRDKPELKQKLTAKELLSIIPGIGKEIGGIVASFLKFSVSTQGIAEFFFGDDPGAVGP